MKLIALFKVLSFIFWCIRQFSLPNPFEVLGEGIVVYLNDTPVLITPFFLNLIAGLILPSFTFLVVKLFYRRGSCPPLGSCLYMFFFCLHTGLLYAMSNAYPSLFSIFLVGIVYILFLIIAFALKIKLSSIW